MSGAEESIPPRLRMLALWLRAVQAADRGCLQVLHRLHPGLQVHAEASSNLAVARYSLAPGAQLRMGPGVVTERRRGLLSFLLEEDAHVEVDERVWLRTELGPILIVAFAGARIEIGPDAFLNGCHLSAKQSVTLGQRAFVGPGTRVFDSDQHDFDDQRAERSEPVRIGDHAWVASDVTVLRGVEIGAHCVVGARSLVTRSIPDHTLAYGTPARAAGPVGDRSRAR